MLRERLCFFKFHVASETKNLPIRTGTPAAKTFTRGATCYAKDDRGPNFTQHNIFIICYTHLDLLFHRQRQDSHVLLFTTLYDSLVAVVTVMSTVLRPPASRVAHFQQQP